MLNAFSIGRLTLASSSLGLLLCLCSACASTPEEHTSQARPNIVFFIADDVPAELMNYHLANQDAPKALTPNLDRLAREGTVIDGMHVASPVCSPSRYTCLTGKFANRSTAVRNDPLSIAANMPLVSWNPEIFPEDDTLPKFLQQAGYRTGLVGKSNVSWYSGRGGDYIWHGGSEPVAEDADPADPEVKRNLRLHYDGVRAFVRSLGFDEVRSLYDYGQVPDHPVAALRKQNHSWITKGGVDFIKGYADDPRPFYLYFSTTIPHSPAASELSWAADTRVTPHGLLDQPLKILPDTQTIPERLEAAGLPMEGYAGNNRAMMLQLDDSLGVLLDELEHIGQLDNTIIVFFNDNGQEGKGSIYQRGMNTPALVWRKGGFPAGARSKALVSNADFAPTIADFAEAEVTGMDGVSQRPILEGQAHSIRESVYGEMGFTRAVRKGDWKYIALRYPENAKEIGLYEEVPDVGQTELPPFGHMATRSDSPGNARVLYNMATRVATQQPHYYDADQLYYLRDDPFEQNNLANDPRHVLKRAEMKAELQKAMAEIPGEFGELK